MDKTKVIIAGSRGFNDYIYLDKTLSYLFKTDKLNEIEIVSGAAKGADYYGEFYAKQNKLDLNVFPADWNKYGKGAGHIRNKEMADYADYLISFWDGQSKGTHNMIKQASEKGLGVIVMLYKTNEHYFINMSNHQLKTNIFNLN